MYIETIPSGFSAFCTLDEKKVVAHYYKKNALVYDNSIPSNSNNASIVKAPEPIKEHTYCHLCNMKYKDYFLHLESKTHKENCLKNKSLYDQIDSSLSRIRAFWNNRILFTKKDKESELEKSISNIIIEKNKDLLSDTFTQTTTAQTLTYTQNLIGEDRGEKKLKKFGKRKYKEMMEAEEELNILHGTNGRYLRNVAPKLVHAIARHFIKMSN